MKNDFSSVTEVTGYNVTQAQLDRSVTRYQFALSNLAEPGMVLEIACGSGQGLGYLAKKAVKVIGIDIDPNLVALGQQQYASRKNIEIHHGDAQKLPFESNQFSQVILYECIYYFTDPIAVIKEIKRVLKPAGNLVYCSVNPEWDAFNPSPFSHKYYSAKEIKELLCNEFDQVEIFASCSAKAKTFKDKLISLIKRIAVKLKLIPQSMKGKEFFKRFFMGKLTPLPGEIEEKHGILIPIIPVTTEKTVDDYIVIYAKAVKY